VNREFLLKFLRLQTNEKKLMIIRHC